MFFQISGDQRETGTRPGARASTRRQRGREVRARRPRPRRRLDPERGSHEAFLCPRDLDPGLHRRARPGHGCSSGSGGGSSGGTNSTGNGTGTETGTGTGTGPGPPARPRAERVDRSKNVCNPPTAPPSTPPRAARVLRRRGGGLPRRGLGQPRLVRLASNGDPFRAPRRPRLRPARPRESAPRPPTSPGRGNQRSSSKSAEGGADRRAPPRGGGSRRRRRRCGPRPGSPPAPTPAR